MNKEERNYLQTELAELWKGVCVKQAEYNAAEPGLDKAVISQELNLKKEMYYHFWMVCNDLGISPVNSVEQARI